MKRLQGKKPFWIWVSTQFNAKICDEKFAIQNIRSFEIFEVIMFNNQKTIGRGQFLFFTCGEIFGQSLEKYNLRNSIFQKSCFSSQTHAGTP